MSNSRIVRGDECFTLDYRLNHNMLDDSQVALVKEARAPIVEDVEDALNFDEIDDMVNALEEILRDYKV